MNSRDNILNELNLMNSFLGQINPENPYHVPGGYFDELSGNILHRIYTNEDGSSKELNAVSRDMPFTVPKGYFDGLEEKIMQAIRERTDYLSPQEELDALSPFLAGLKKQIPYSVPSGYFDSIPVKKPAVKVVSITRLKWFRYAAAAVVIGIISMAAVLYISGKSVRPADENKAWAKIEKKVEKLSDKEINDFVEFNEKGFSASETAGLQQVNKEEIQDLLMDVSASEMKDFLDQTSDGVHDALMLN